MAQAQGALNPCYLVVGTDDLKRDTAIRRLRARLDPGLEVFNYEERDGATTKVDDVPALVASLETLPMGDGIRIVVVRNADRLPKRASEAVVAYLKDPTPGTVLLLVADKLAANTALYKAAKAAGPRAVIDCAPLKRWKLPPLVAKMAQGYGVTMDEAAAEELVSRVGESTNLIDAQLKTLSVICRQTGRITRADVEANVARVAETKPWDFLDAVSARDAHRALEQYQLLRANYSQTALVSMVTQRVRELVCARSLDARGQGAGLADELGKQAFQVKHHLMWARRFAPGALEHDLVACARADEALKSGADADAELVRLVATICA